MAYLIEILVPPCRHQGCHAKATYTLHNEWNAVVATYCGIHANRHLDSLKQSERDSGRAAGDTTLRRGSAQ